MADDEAAGGAEAPHPVASSAVRDPLSAESTAAFERYFLTRRGGYAEALRETDMVTPDGYLKVDNALAKWSPSDHMSTNFYEWCRSDMNNVKSIVRSLNGVALIGGQHLLWPHSAAEAVEAWGPGGDGPWETGAFELCWRALLDNATLLDITMPLFKYHDTPEGGEWLVVLSVASAISLTPGFEPEGHIEAKRLMRYWTWVCNDILDLPGSHPLSAAMDAAQHYLYLLSSEDRNHLDTEEDGEEYLLELMTLFNSNCGMGDNKEDKAAKRSRPANYPHQASSGSG